MKEGKEITTVTQIYNI